MNWDDVTADPIGDIRRLTQLVHSLPVTPPIVKECEICKKYGDLNVWYEWIITISSDTYTINRNMELVPLRKKHYYHKDCYDNKDRMRLL